MKYFILAILATCVVGCQSRSLIPSHVGIKSGVEWQMAEGYYTITKPSIHGCVDWNL